MIARPKFGIYLPQFDSDFRHAVTTAVAAEDAGLDGVFVLDHLWAPSNPSKASLPIFPLLHVVTDATERVALGTLVAKVGLRSDGESIDAFNQLHQRLGSRLVAGLGTGDANSEPEYRSLGVAMAPMAERRRRLSSVAHQLRHAGATVWLGGLSPAMRTLAAGQQLPLNLWCPDATRLELAANDQRPWTWGGTVPCDLESALPALKAAVRAGAQWLVLAPGGIASGPERVKFAATCRAALLTSVD